MLKVSISVKSEILIDFEFNGLLKIAKSTATQRNVLMWKFNNRNTKKGVKFVQS